MADTETQYDRVVTLVVKSLPPMIGRETVTPSASLRGDLGLDSMALVAFLFRCADEFAVDPNDMVEALADRPIQTVEDVVKLGLAMLDSVARGKVVETHSV